MTKNELEIALSNSTSAEASNNVDSFTLPFVTVDQANQLFRVGTTQQGKDLIAQIEEACTVESFAPLDMIKSGKVVTGIELGGNIPENLDDNTAKNFPCIFLISVGKPVFEGENLEASIEILNKFKACLIIPAGTLQAHNLSAIFDIPLTQAREISAKLENDWLRRNGHIFRDKLKVPFAFLHWDTIINNATFRIRLEEIEALEKDTNRKYLNKRGEPVNYKDQLEVSQQEFVKRKVKYIKTHGIEELNNPTLKIALEIPYETKPTEEQLSQIETRLIESSKNYIKEEGAGLSSLTTIPLILYLCSSETAAHEALQSLLVRPQFGDILKWCVININSHTPKKIVQNSHTPKPTRKKLKMRLFPEPNLPSSYSRNFSNQRKTDTYKMIAAQVPSDNPPISHSGFSYGDIAQQLNSTGSAPIAIAAVQSPPDSPQKPPSPPKTEFAERIFEQSRVSLKQSFELTALVFPSAQDQREVLMYLAVRLTQYAQELALDLEAAIKADANNDIVLENISHDHDKVQLTPPHLA